MIPTMSSASDPASENYEFSCDWLSSNIPVWQQITDHLKPRKILEVGAYEGGSTCWLITTCSAHHSIELHAVDTWDGGEEHQGLDMSVIRKRFVRNVQLAQSRAGNPVTLVEHVMQSDDALLKILNEHGAGSFDLIYIDGSHRAPDVIIDAILGFKLLRSQGVMIFDDYPWKTDAGGTENPLNSPKMAIDAFTTLFAQQLDIVQRVPLYQFIVKKR